MGFWDKFRNRAKMNKGRVKEKAGRASGDPVLETRGEGERASGAARQVTEQVKDAGKNLREGFKP